MEAAADSAGETESGGGGGEGGWRTETAAASASAAGAGCGCGGGGGDEEVSTGDNSLTSCEDDVLSTGPARGAGAQPTSVTLIGLQLHHQPFPSPSVAPPHPSSAAGANGRHNTLAAGLPSTLQLCKVGIQQRPSV